MFMRYLGNGIGHQATNHIQFDDFTTIIGHSGSNSESIAELGELNENSESDDDHDVGELNEISNDSDRELEEAISNEDDDFG